MRYPWKRAISTSNFTKKSIGSQSKQWSKGQEFEQQEDEIEAWDKMMNKELHSLMMDASATPGKGSTRSIGKGAGKGKGKGKGNRKGQRGESDDDPEDEEKTVEEKIKGGLKKLRKSRDLMASTMSNYEEALDKVKKKQYLSKAAKKEKEQQMKDLESTLGKVKKHLGKGEGPSTEANLKAIQDLLKAAVHSISEAKEEAKELVQITMETTSKSSRTS